MSRPTCHRDESATASDLGYLSGGERTRTADFYVANVRGSIRRPAGSRLHRLLPSSTSQRLPSFVVVSSWLAASSNRTVIVAGHRDRSHETSRQMSTSPTP